MVGFGSVFTPNIRQKMDGFRLQAMLSAKDAESVSSLKRIWMRRDVIVASLSLNILGLALPILVLQVYDRVLKHQVYETLVVLSGLVLIAFVLEFILRITRASILNHVGASSEYRISQDLFERILSTDTATYAKGSTNTYIEALQSVGKIKNFYSRNAVTLIADCPFLLVYLVLIAFIAGWLALVPLAFLAAYALATWSLSTELRATLKEQDQADKRRHVSMIEVLSKIQTVKGLGADRYFSKKHEHSQKDSSQLIEKLTVVNAHSQALSQFFSQFATIAVISGGAVIAVNGGLTIGGLAATSMLTGRILQPVTRAFFALLEYQSISIAEKKLSELNALPKENAAGEPLHFKLFGEIRLDNVSFHYTPDTPVFENINLHAPPGSIIGLTGATASGKTTLLKLIGGHLTPTNGEVQIDDLPIQELNYQQLRTQIGFLPSEAAIFAGTLLDNITMFREGDPRDQAINAIAQARLHKFVASLPDGLETQIGSAGALPSGIVQMIAVARVLIDGPPILLFDNANRGLDRKTDRDLLEALAELKGGCTIILATDRPSYLDICNEVYEIVDKTLVRRPEKKENEEPSTDIVLSSDKTA